MKLIKPGFPLGKEIVAKCNNCKCEFSFHEREGRFEHSPRNENYIVIKCPQGGCGREVWIEV
jgi:hypothetical protein